MLKKLAIAALLILFALGVGLKYFPAAAVESGPVQAVLVEDVSHRTASIGAIVASPAIRQYAKTHNVTWHVVDVNAQGPDLAEVAWAVEAIRSQKSDTLPALVIRQGDGRYIHVYPLPSTPAEVVAVLDRYTPRSQLPAQNSPPK